MAVCMQRGSGISPHASSTGRHTSVNEPLGATSVRRAGAGITCVCARVQRRLTSLPSHFSPCAIPPPRLMAAVHGFWKSSWLRVVWEVVTPFSLSLHTHTHTPPAHELGYVCYWANSLRSRLSISFARRKVHLLTLQPSGHLMLAYNNHNHAGAGNAHCKVALDWFRVRVRVGLGLGLGVG